MRCMPVPVESACPTLHMIFRTIIPGPAATDRCPAIEARGVVFIHLLHPVVAIAHPVACRLITCRHHHERGVMAIGVDNAFRLLQQILINLLPATESDAVIRPRRPLRLQIETYTVGSGKGCFRWTIAVETHMVQSIGFALAEDLQP